MKNRIFAIASVLVLVAAVAAGIANAQPPVMRVSVPFAFTVENQTLPAGDYVIERVIPGQPNCLRIEDEDGRPVKTILTNSALRPSAGDLPAELMFDRYGNQYFLTQIWSFGDTYGHQLPKSAAEKELARRETKVEVAVLIRPSAK